jgi:Ca2+-transporting ATPase
MITGDHPLTARAIAGDLGIAGDAALLTGQDLDRLSEAELAEQVGRVAVYARVAPEHKLRIVQALQQQNHIVAMTGDGVNDAPALKQADIGVAMGERGSDVAREVADLVLMDDNFATIVAAVEEGRVIYANIRKFIQYILAGNVGELWVMLLAPLFGMPLPLLPLQILWINLVTDGLPALALGLEPAERSTMQRPPHRPNESIFARGLGVRVLVLGLLTGAASLGVGFGYWMAGRAAWQTMVFTTLTLAQMALALGLRSDRDSLLRIGLGTNKPLLGAVALTVGLQAALIYLPFLQDIFHTTPLAMGDLALSLGLSGLVLAVVEVEKWWRRRQPARS